MAVSVICPRQDHPPLSDVLFTREWWLYLYNLGKGALRSNFIATCGTGMDLTDTYQTVTDLEGILPTAGLWVVVGVFYFINIGPGENGAFGRLLLNDLPEDAVAALGNDGGLGSGTAMQLWPVNVSAGATIKLQAKTNVTGFGHVNPDSSRLFALLVQPA